jgi:hypothetical protein
MHRPVKRDPRRRASALAGDLAGGRVSRQLPRLGRGEKLVLDPILGHPVVAQCRRDRQHHRFGPADEGGVGGADIDPAIEQGGAFPRVHPAGEQFHILGPLFEDVQDRQPAHMQVLQILEFLAEHDRGQRAVGIDQRDLCAGLARQHGFHDRQHRRDARPAGKGQIGARGGGIERGVEPTLGRHCLQNLARAQLFIRPGRKRPPIDPLDANLQEAVIEARTDRIAAAQFLAVEIAPEGQILPLGEGEGRRIFGPGGQRDRHRIADRPANVGHRQVVEPCHRALRCI